MNSIRFLRVFLFLAISVSIISCETSSSEIENGSWNFELEREDGNNIVFQVIAADSMGKKYLYLANAEERILVDDIVYSGDSVFIELPFFNSYFRLQQQGNQYRGLWFKNLGNRIQEMPVRVYKSDERFAAPAAALYDITGRWETVFVTDTGRKIPAVGEFIQKGNFLSGSFLLPSGDYRYLEGVVSGDSLKLSAFDGNHAFYFEAIINADSTIGKGRFFSGPVTVQQWSSIRNEEASLEGLGQITGMKPGFSSLNFSFPSTDGDTISINDERFRNKVTIVQIMGSWCPNCMDETQFLSEYYALNKQKGLEIVALAYERTTDFEQSVKSLSSFQRRFDVKYPILVTGVAVSDSLRTEKTLPQIDNINYFPTTIFIDKAGIVRKIHAGFTGPGTGEHYLLFKQEFDEFVSGLLAE